jgi:hypothetical protein
MATESRESATLNLKCIKGTSFRRTLTYKDSNDLAINLTNYTINFVIKDYDINKKTILSLTNGNGITLTGASGLIEILINNTQTDAFLKSKYFYTLKIIDPNGLISELIRGTFYVIDGVE